MVALEQCEVRWQVFRRDRNNYTIFLPSGGALVTILDDVVVRVDPPRNSDATWSSRI